MSSVEARCENMRSNPLNVIAIWLRALRSESFPVSVVPALLGVAVAWEQGYRIDPLLAVLTVLGALAIHAATNLLQDYFDFKSGIDRDGTLGGSGILVKGVLRPRSILIASTAFFFISALLAGYLVYARGFALAWLMGGGLIVGAGYSIPTYGLKYNMLGDIGVFLAFGIGITMGSYYIQTGAFNWYPLVYAVPFGLLVDALLHSNNMRDALDDDGAGLRNVACRMGERMSRAFYCSLLIGAYVFPVIAIFLRIIPRGALFVLLTFPLALKLMKTMLKSGFRDKQVLGNIVIRTALLTLLFGLAMVLGIVGYRIAGV